MLGSNLVFGKRIPRSPKLLFSVFSFLWLRCFPSDCSEVVPVLVGCFFFIFVGTPLAFSSTLQLCFVANFLYSFFEIVSCHVGLLFWNRLLESFWVFRYYISWASWIVFWWIYIPLTLDKVFLLILFGNVTWSISKIWLGDLKCLRVSTVRRWWVNICSWINGFFID